MTALASAVGQALAGARARVKEPKQLGPGALDWLVEAEDAPAARHALKPVLEPAPVDWALQPWAGRRKRVLAADMDSTIIGCECIDELADFAGVRAEVAAVTEAAMRGELDFEQALSARVARLAGLPLQALQRCYHERVRLNPGASVLVRTMAAHGASCVLVSGGFTFFAERVARAAGFQAFRANVLGHDGERLTGEVARPIVGREAKLTAMTEACMAQGAGLDAALALGDGANDLAMIRAAGLGVAYRAKPVVAAEADARIDHADLTAALYFQGYAATEWAPA